MTPQADKAQVLDEIYALLRRAAAGTWRRCMTACRDCCVRMCWAGTGKVVFARFAISMEAVAAAACGWGRREGAAGAASRWTNSAMSSYGQASGGPSRVPVGRAVLRKSTLTPMLNPGMIRKKGSVGVAAVTPDPKRCVAWRSSADYAARGERGDPRGRKSGAGPGAMNAR